MSRSIIIAGFIILFGNGILLAQSNFAERLSEAAIELILDTIEYDPSYYSIPYPNGDVPSNVGVCSDVIIRAYRKLGIDLQKEVHVDMEKNFDKYPKLWGLTKTDKNIDHRRVPNLQTFFKRKGNEITITDESKDYQPGDIVTWDLGNGISHIGIIVNRLSNDKERYLIVHNIGNGQVLEDCLFKFTITGHYRFFK